MSVYQTFFVCFLAISLFFPRFVVQSNRRHPSALVIEKVGWFVFKELFWGHIIFGTKLYQGDTIFKGSFLVFTMSIPFEKMKLFLVIFILMASTAARPGAVDVLTKVGSKALSPTGRKVIGGIIVSTGLGLTVKELLDDDSEEKKKDAEKDYGRFFELFGSFYSKS